MKTSLRTVTLLGFVWLTACGGIHVTISPRPTIVDVGTSVTFTATVSNDSLNGGVIWSLTGAGEIVAASSSSIVYNAPQEVPADASVTIRAVAVDNNLAADSVIFTLR